MCTLGFRIVVFDLEIWSLEIALLTRCGDELGVWGAWNVHVIGGQVMSGRCAVAVVRTRATRGGEL